MIPRAHITGWRSRAPWSTDAQIEQDLVICRTLVEIFSDSLAAREVAFRGGTALHVYSMRSTSPESLRTDVPSGKVICAAGMLPFRRGCSTNAALQPNRSGKSFTLFALTTLPVSWSMSE